MTMPEGSTCSVYQMETSVSQVLEDTTCGVILSPQFPGTVAPNQWTWTVEGADDYMFVVNVYYVQGPNIATSDCSEYFKGELKIVKQVIFLSNK